MVGGIVGGGLVLAALRIIHAQNADHEEQNKGENYYRSLLEAVPDMIFFMDEHGTFLDYIPATDIEPLIPEESFFNKTYHEVLPPEVAALHDQAFNDVYEKDEIRRVEYQLEVPSGIRDYEARLIRTYDDKVMSMVRDITERKKALRNVQRQAQEMAALHGISVDITAAHELNDLLDTAVRRTVELLEAQFGAIYLKDKKDVYQQKATFLRGGDSETFPLQLGRQIAEGSARGSQVRLLGEEDLAALSGDDHHVWESLNVLSAPLVWDERVIGAINVWVESKSKQERELDLDLSWLGKLATQIAIAVRNAQLVSNLETQLLLSQTMHEVGALLTSQASLEEVVAKVLDLLDRMVSFDSASILLLGEDDRLHLSASRGIENVDSVRDSIHQHADELLPQSWIERKTVYVSDTRKSQAWVDIPETSYIRSWIGAVLYAQDSFIGILNVDNKEVDAYDSEQMRTVRSFADQAAIAIENARLFEEKQISHHRLQVLYELNNQLAETLDWETIINRSTAIARNALDGEVSDYYQYHPDNDEIELICSHGRGEEEINLIKNKLITLEDTGDLQWVLENQTSVRMSNVLEDDRWVVIPNLDNQIRSLITVPVFIDDQLSGALSVLQCDQDAFSVEHEELLNAISQQTGLALNNARRYKEVERLIDALEARQAMQNTLFDHLPVGVMLLDDQYRILSSNELGKDYVRVLNDHRHRDQLKTLGSKDLDELVLYEKDPRPLEISGNAGEPRTFEVQIRPVSSASESYWVLMIDDVTQERDRDRRLQMQERLATIGQFAAGIAHDFNNIMSAIMVYTDVLSRDGNLSSQNVDRIQVIQKQAQRATDLISQILDFSRHSVIQRKVIDLVPFIREMKTLLERVMPEDIPISLDVEDGIPPLTVNGDPTRLQQMVMNLAVNARDAMPQGGRLQIGLQRRLIEEYQIPPVPGMTAGQWVQISVRDDGVGIPDQERQHIFEPFYTTKESGEGTGLGLAQVYGIVKQHEGFIDVESTVGEGTTLLIYLPLIQESDQVQAREEARGSIDGQGELVLIVEDDKSLRNALWNLFEECNFQVILAKNGQKGLEILEQIGGKISIVISDLVMPVMGGMEMYRKARELYPHKRFLFITGHKEASRKIDVIQDPNIRRLQKPFTMEEIITSVRELYNSTPTTIKQ